MVFGHTRTTTEAGTTLPNAFHFAIGIQELAWESEKKRLAVSKLRKHFLDDLKVEHIMLHAFRSVITSVRQLHAAHIYIQVSQHVCMS